MYLTVGQSLKLVEDGDLVATTALDGTGLSRHRSCLSLDDLVLFDQVLACLDVVLEFLLLKQFSHILIELLVVDLHGLLDVAILPEEQVRIWVRATELGEFEAGQLQVFELLTALLKLREETIGLLIYLAISGIVILVFSDGFKSSFSF